MVECGLRIGKGRGSTMSWGKLEDLAGIEEWGGLRNGGGDHQNNVNPRNFPQSLFFFRFMKNYVFKFKIKAEAKIKFNKNNFPKIRIILR